MPDQVNTKGTSSLCLGRAMTLVTLWDGSEVDPDDFPFNF